jgi:hypothetical protein
MNPEWLKLSNCPEIIKKAGMKGTGKNMIQLPMIRFLLNRSSN